MQSNRFSKRKERLDYGIESADVQSLGAFSWSLYDLAVRDPARQTIGAGKLLIFNDQPLRSKNDYHLYSSEEASLMCGTLWLVSSTSVAAGRRI